MNKELLFDNIVEGIFSTITIKRVDQGKLINKKSEIWIESEDGKEIYLTYIPYAFNNAEIHGNTRITLAKEFIDNYTFNSLKTMYNAKLAKEIKHIESEENNKNKLENLIIELNLNKFKNYTRNKEDIKIIYNYNTKKYYISLELNNNINIEIYNNNNYKEFIFKIDYKEIDPATFKTALEEIYINVKTSTEEKEKAKEERLKEESRKQLEKDKIYFLYKNVSDYNIILKTGKKTFMTFNNGLRYSVGTGKSGKFYRCSWTNFEEIILKKGIEKVSYCLIDKETKTTNTDEYYLNLEYRNII